MYPSSTTSNYSWDSLSDATQIAYTWQGSYTPGNGGAPGTCTPGTTTGTGTGTLKYAYDQDGRQISRGGTYFNLVLPSAFAANTVSYNADNQQTLWNGLSNVFDANGNLTCTGSPSSTSCTGSQSQALAWDARSRLVTAAGAPALGGSAESYIYDGLSRRQSVTNATAGTKATYLYEGLNPVVVTTTNISSGGIVDLTKIFVGLGLDERYQLNGSSATDTGSVITDVQGSTLQLENNLTTEVSYRYPPFGSTGSPSTASLNTFRYTGREASDNTGLYYLRGRYYSPTQSRFTAEDPLGLLAGSNVYAYVGNDPLNAIDPMGKSTFQIGISLGGTILGFVVPQAGFGIAIGSHGGVGVYAYAGGGSGLGVQAGVGGSVQFSNAVTIGDLSGPFNNTSLNAGAGVGGSIDFFTGSSSNGPVTGGGITFGASAGASGSLTVTDTAVIPLNGNFTASSTTSGNPSSQCK